MSSSRAAAYHSITIGDKNTWDDWHLVPTSRPKFNMPPVKTNYIDIPGGDGVIDLSTALTGRPTYGNRQGSFEFLVLKEDPINSDDMNDGEWYDRYSEIATYLHGKEFRATLDDEPSYYYEGRFSVNEWKSEAHWSKIVIDYNVGPYKKSSLSVVERWLWDPFFLGDPNDPSDTGDVIRIYKNLIVTGTLVVTYVGDVYQDTPVITCSKYNNSFNMNVTFGNVTQKLSLGTNVMHKFSFSEGNNVLTFSGTGIVTIQNTGGRL